MSETRTETDALGSREIPAGALHGIHTLRALENFPLSGHTVHPALMRAYGWVKLACAEVNAELGLLPAKQAGAIASAARELAEGRWEAETLPDALQGGAGTSTNMAVNEWIANRALQLMGREPGDYETLDPLEQVNLHQSTNDTFPTALKLAAILELRKMEEALVALLEAFQEKEKAFAHIVKVGRTQMQDAVLTTLGREMGAYADALARDRWRVSKCAERLRVVNLGATAIGTGLGAPRRFIFKATDRLRELTGVNLARAENLVEATQNADVYVEVSGILRALGSSLMKTSGDLRLLSSGPSAGLGEVRLVQVQAGSSIMPDKVNPVIPEAVTQAAMAVMGHDHALTMACSSGSLELNPFLPLVADALLSELNLLENACRMLAGCVEGMEANAEACKAHVENATATVTALVPLLGYRVAEEIAREARRQGRTIRQQALASGKLTPEQFDEAISPEAVMRLGSPPMRKTELKEV